MTRPRFNRLLTLQSRHRAPDGAGGFVEHWVNLGQLWAQVRATGGRENMADHASLSQVSYDITVRASPHGAPSRPQPDQRLTEGPRVFRILAVAERDTTNRYLSLRAIEETAQ
ncbi:MAG: head-tail adaptor protein [Pseudomonadota bacterium]